MKKYINKYDFIKYFTHPSYFWFWSINEIEEVLNTNINFDDEENEDDDENDVDSYEKLKNLKTDGKVLTDDDPIIIEGNLIDQIAKKSIIDHFEIDNIVDFETKEYNHFKNETKAKLTKEKLRNLGENFILFQPVFISGNLITKPDAIVCLAGLFYLVEVKGTSTVKRHHILDLYFQKKVIEGDQTIELEDYFLCVVKYEKLGYKEVSMVFTNGFNYQKNGPDIKKYKNLKEQKIEIIALQKIGKLGDEDGEYLRLKSVLNFDFEYFIKPLEITNKTVLYQRQKNYLDWHRYFSCFESHLVENELLNEGYQVNFFYPKFETIINELKTFRKRRQIVIEPYKNMVNWYKNPGFLRIIKDIVGRKYHLFSFSGIIVKTKVLLEHFDFVHSRMLPINLKNDFYNAIISGDGKSIIVNQAAYQEWNKIKKKKIYFDFETINLAVRPIANCLPFTQVVTQCSVIFFDGEKASDCFNLICDPLKISLNFFEEIIDLLYIEEHEEYSYVVYNNSFETSRLKEMAVMIGKEDYRRKVKAIIGNFESPVFKSNLTDLANFFDVRKRTIINHKLKGFYSIKKVLPLIDPQILIKTNTKLYSDLKVQNGLNCQKLTTLRFFNQINDQEWSTIAHDLQLYCENDVRAMIAVEMYVKSLLESHNQSQFNKNNAF